MTRTPQQRIKQMHMERMSLIKTIHLKNRQIHQLMAENTRLKHRIDDSRPSESLAPEEDPMVNMVLVEILRNDGIRCSL
jgi:hypothetical protein